MSISIPILSICTFIFGIVLYVTATHPQEFKSLLLIIGNVVIGTVLVVRRMLAMWWAEVVAKILCKCIIDTAKLQVRIDKMNDRIDKLRP